MSYVQANTQNALGRRGLGRMGWDNVPYPVYRQTRSISRLNGDFNPAGGDPSTSTNGAVTYRIDPRSGKYNFYRTDIKPRGVFMQNTFQHPAEPTMSALGIRLGRGTQMIQRGRTSPGLFMPLNPRLQLSGLGCNSCSRPRFVRRRRGMGDDVFAGCTLDANGNFSCTPLPASNAPSGAAFQPGGIFSDPSTFAPGPSPVTTAINAVGQVFAPKPNVVPVAAPSWLNQTSSIAGAAIPNSLLAIGGALIAALGMESSRGRR